MYHLPKRLMVIGLVACLAFTSVACGKTPQAAEPNASSSATQNASQPKTSLRQLNVWQQDDYNTYSVATMLVDKTGYKVQYDMLPRDNPVDKLNLLIASGESYDMITTAGGSDFKALYSDYAKRGALVDLTPLIEKYAPNVKASISQESLDAMKVDGKIYGIPSRVVSSSTTSLMIRTDWLEKLNLQMPTTLDELVAVLKAFKEKDPGGNGDRNIPMTISGALIDNIVGAFGMPNTWNDVNSKLVPRPLDDSFKEYALFVSDLFKQGLLEKEFPTNQSATAREKFTSGRVGVLPVGWYDVPSITDALLKNQPTAKLSYIPALSGPNGKKELSATSGFDRLTYIPKSAKHPEDAMKYINMKLNEDIFKNMAIGEEGKHYTFKDGVYMPIQPAFMNERTNGNNYMAGTDEQKYPLYWQARIRKDARLFDAWNYLNVKQPSKTRMVDPLGMAPFMDQYSKYNQALGSMVNDYLIKLIVGVEPISGLASFQDKFRKSGGETSMKEVNDWYASVKKK